MQKQINEGFPDGSADGPVLSDKVHFMHPTINQHHETINPAIHGTFASAQVMINFTKSGNHNSNFTKAAIIALRNQGLLETNENDFDEDDEDDVFGVEEGGLDGLTTALLLFIYTCG